MSSDVVLTSALRSNLLSLQSTQRLIDTTQLRLATGLKVNSALDNPQNFFAAQSLNNRAGDLSRLLDGIALSVRTIENANSGVTALTNLIEQANSIVNSARDILAASEGEARITGTTDISDFTDLVADAGFTNNDTFTISTIADTGLQITETITVNTGDTGASLAAKITNAFADNRDSEISASVNDNGFLEIFSNDGRSFRIEGGTAAATAVSLAEFTAIGLGNYFQVENTGAAATNTQAAATIVAGNTLTSRSIYEDSGDLIEAGDLLTGTYEDVDGTTVISGLAAGDSFSFSINNTATASFTVTATSTFQDLLDAINSSTAVNQLIEARFDQKTGSISIDSLSGEVNTLEISFTDAAAGGAVFNIGFGDESANFDPLTGTAIAAGQPQSRVFSLTNTSVELVGLASDYNEVRNQIDRIALDANFQGVNLLLGDDLTTFFNENLTSRLVTQGVDFSSSGLGLTETNFENGSVIESVAEQVRDALDAVRAFGTTLANDLSIIQTRRDFTQETINTLTSGADDLTVADQNEEGANLLALQTRQQLGVTSLSLAAQSQQSVLALF